MKSKKEELREKYEEAEKCLKKLADEAVQKSREEIQREIDRQMFEDAMAEEAYELWEYTHR